MTADPARARALAYLGSHSVMALATQGGAGPWAAAVFYASEGFTLYWLSSPSSRHSMDLARDPRVAACVQEDYADWREIKGLQIEGRARELAGGEAKRARALYGGKFAVVDDGPAAIAAAVAKARFYRLVPERLYLIDNAVAFGRRLEVELDLP